jgi:hypothetical protein
MESGLKLDSDIDSEPESLEGHDDLNSVGKRSDVVSVQCAIELELSVGHESSQELQLLVDELDGQTE